MASNQLPIWIFEVGTYRTASTMHYRMLRDILELTRNGIGIGYENERKLVGFDEPLETGQFVASKVFKFLPKTSTKGKQFFDEGRLKAICAVRDPRDIAVSMRRRATMHKMEWDLEQVVTKEFPIWLGQLQRWISLGSQITLVSKYERMIHNLEGEVARIAKHIGVNVPRNLLRQVAQEASIRGQQRAKEGFRKRKSVDPSVREDPWLPSVPAIIFGTAGHWKQHLEPEEAALIKRVCAGFMRRWEYM